MLVLTRGRKGRISVPSTCLTSLRSHEKPTADGLSMTPSDIERLARKGIAVSVPNSDSFLYNDEKGWDIPPELTRDADRNSMWETSQPAKQRILDARRNDKRKFG